MELEESRGNVYSQQRMSLERNGVFGTSIQQSVRKIIKMENINCFK